jgi:hypothetical protein
METRVSFKKYWLVIIGIALTVVGIGILAIIYYSAPDMGSKHYSDLSNENQWMFWISVAFTSPGVVCITLWIIELLIGKR